MQIHTLTDEHLSVVGYYYRRYAPLVPLSFRKDLKQEGYLGLLHAARKFDASQGCQFLSYAHYWIRSYMRSSVPVAHNLIHIPNYMNDRVLSVRRFVARYISDHCRPPTTEEIAAQLRIGPRKRALTVNEVAEVLDGFTSLQTLSSVHCGDSDPVDLVELVRDPRSVDEPREQLLINERNKWLDLTLDTLTPKRRDIIRRRFGLAPYAAEQTLETIAKVYGNTREAIRLNVEFGLKALKNVIEQQNSDTAEFYP